MIVESQAVAFNKLINLIVRYKNFFFFQVIEKTCSVKKQTTIISTWEAN